MSLLGSFLVLTLILVEIAPPTAASIPKLSKWSFSVVVHKAINGYSPMRMSVIVKISTTYSIWIVPRDIWYIPLPVEAYLLIRDVGMLIVWIHLFIIFKPTVAHTPLRLYKLKHWHTPACDLFPMMKSSNGNIFNVTGPLCGEFTGHRWTPLTMASGAELWCFLWSGPEQTVE